MKVVFLKDVQGTASSGDVKEVAPGFARNFLFPRSLATKATSGAIKHAERTRDLGQRRLQHEREEAEDLAQRLGSVYLNLTARAGEEGRLFGSITSQDVAEALELQFGIKVDRRKISFPDSIRSVGSWVAEVKLSQGLDATINLNVEAAD
jgi:large subunit ribosomal protein L9